MKHFTRVILGLTIGLFAMTAMAEVPQLINYQGNLTDIDGNPVPNGSYQITFTIYDTPTGNPGIWNSGSQAVSVANGVFTYQLGTVNVLPDDLFTDTTRWLGIRVGIDPEMTPRIKLTSQPYAYHALRSDSALTADNADNLGGETPAFYNDWNNLVNVPTGLDDGDDNTTYTAGSGLQLAGTVFSIPADGISSAQIQNEPGVAQALMAVVTPLTGSVEIVLSREITAPASGYVLVIASFSVQALHVNGTSTGVVFGLSNSTAFGQDAHYWGVMSSEATGSRNDIITISRMFSVSAGATTFYLLGQKSSGGTNPDVYSKSLSLAYFPTAYGTFNNF